MFNFLGIVSALATFGGVWLGHVAVRQVEFRARSLLIPVLTTLGLGLCVLVLSLLTGDRRLSAALGIFGITLLCDAYELKHQEQRVRRGRAPANPHNPRHVRILNESPAATTFEWLKREPRRAAYSAEELQALKDGNA